MCVATTTVAGKGRAWPPLAGRGRLWLAGAGRGCGWPWPAVAAALDAVGFTGSGPWQLGDGGVGGMLRASDGCCGEEEVLPFSSPMMMLVRCHSGGRVGEGLQVLTRGAEVVLRDVSGLSRLRHCRGEGERVA